ncbi:MAG: NADH-quinone oxidoreductase subunit C [Nitrospiraceae bacterium]|nr:NADH-quinone oxidoreductase subunit C [Nitrospira sp.]MCB9774730.1 NADH-quinone oxidoreductase subunit C [Nitrospiraceae bacterium]
MEPVLNSVEHLQSIFGPAIQRVFANHGIPVVRVHTNQISSITRYIHANEELRGTLSLLWAVDHRPRDVRYELWYLFTLGESKDWIIVSTDLSGEERFFESITPKVHAANWYEREIRDMFGLIAQGHPDLRRLVRHNHWPKGIHPLQKNFPWNSVLQWRQPPGSVDGHFIHGEGVFEVPVGPIHAGIIEPGHFRFTVAGEPIMHLDLQHFWKHRGVEKLFEQQTLSGGVALAERISGDTTLGHSLAYCQAVEMLWEIHVPRRARYLRSIFLELERLHNHIGDVGGICNDTAYGLAHAHCSRLKERVMQLNDRLTGSRFLRGVNCVGGVGIDLSTHQFSELVTELEHIERDFSELEQIIAVNASLIDRFESTGILKKQTAWDHGVVGVVGRASGIDRDLRRDRPFAAYDELSVRVAGSSHGDVRARVQVRVSEIHESIRIIREIHHMLPDGPLKGERQAVPDSGAWALSAVEAWRGEILYFLMIGEHERIHRCKVRDPSFVNWPAIQMAVIGNIIPDFPLINKSFSLSYAGNDL